MRGSRCSRSCRAQGLTALIPCGDYFIKHLLGLGDRSGLVAAGFMDVGSRRFAQAAAALLNIDIQ
jgi:hypothetical protein